MRTFFLIILCLVFSNSFAQTMQMRLDSLLEVGKELHEDKKFVEATEVFDKLIELCKEKKNPFQLAECYYKIGDFYYVERIHSKALAYLFEGITVLSKKHPKPSSAYFYVSNPNLDSHWGVAYLTLEEKKEGVILLIGIYNRIGSCYFNQEDYEKADIYWQKTLAFGKANDCRKAISGALNNLGEIFRIKENYIGALGLYKQSFDIKETIKDSFGMAIAFANIGNTYIQMKQLDSAKLYYDKGAEVSDLIKSVFLEMGFYQQF